MNDNLKFLKSNNYVANKKICLMHIPYFTN